MNRSALGIIVCIVAVSFTGCSTIKVKRIDVDKPVDISGAWNDFDATVSAKALIADCLAKPWLTGFMKNSGREPVVIVGNINNRTAEHINAEVISKGLEYELLNSGNVKFVASPEERVQMRAERADQQQGYTSPETMAQLGREHGADYMLIGSINSVKDELKGKAVVFYKVNLELVDLTTNMKTWIGQHEIKKTVTQSKFGF